MAKRTKAYTRPGGFNRIWREMFDSPAYRGLSLVARGLLNEFIHIYRPERNGLLSISVRNAGDRLNCAERTARKAFSELVAHGFLKLTVGPCWQQGKAREWRLTFEECNNREPTDEWKSWTYERPIERHTKKFTGALSTTV